MMQSSFDDKGNLDDATRALMLLMSRVVGRTKRMPVPESLQAFALAPRHRSLLAYLVFDGPLRVNELAARLEVAPATVSLMVGDLSRHGVVVRREDDADRRRIVVSIADEHREAVEGWLAGSGRAWRAALEPLTAAQRQLFVDTFRTYEQALGSDSWSTHDSAQPD